MLGKQAEEFKTLVKECRNAFKNKTSDLLENLKLERINLDTVLNALDEEQEKIELENAQKLSPYITALARINEQIDLEGLTIHSMNESLKYREEVNRLHGLAQLGITVEIIGHEIEGLDMTIMRGLKTIAADPLNEKQNAALDTINIAQQTLSDKWRFLSPLKLSGEKTMRKITGSEIIDHVNHYFQETLKERNVEFISTKAFLTLSIYEMPSRIYPVFVNLVNNSQYWVEYSNIVPKKIMLDATDDEVIVADTGPGVSKDDLELLFTLFFTTKQRGGRGIGLYLCRQNLAVGGHIIRYVINGDQKILPGANFAISFKGMKK
jgi:signal transduction histidine kinase